MNIPNFASRCHANRSARLLSAWNERAWTASATAPSLARKILLLCRIFGSLRRQYLPMLSITGESVASYELLWSRGLTRWFRFNLAVADSPERLPPRHYSSHVAIPSPIHRSLPPPFSD